MDKLRKGLVEGLTIFGFCSFLLIVIVVAKDIYYGTHKLNKNDWQCTNVEQTETSKDSFVPKFECTEFRKVK